MTDLESRVSATLAERVDRPFPVEHLHERAVRRARGIRRRRRLLGTAAAAILALGLFALDPTGGGAPAATSLPPEPAAPPGGIGSDRALLHFDVDLSRIPAPLADRVAATEWVSGEGYESVVALDAGEHPVFIVALGVESLTADGWMTRFDGGSTRALRWQSGNVYGVTSVDWEQRDLLPKVVSAVRLDEVQRCVMPLRLAELPEGASWTECQTRIRRGGQAGGSGPATAWVSSGLTIRRADGHVVYIWANAQPAASPSFRPDRTVAGYPAQWRDGDGQSQAGLWVLAFGPYQLYVTDLQTRPADWFTPEEAAWYTARLTPSTNLDDPSTWPRRAVG
ncbi:hypothetical protein [Dactylosporangium sp. NPDC048998]|uniref:hypothetical protein n=1 Tax=Dactylosporangium sp. NPDC048998 TaxID=3363976 RepID=UPI00371286AC